MKSVKWFMVLVMGVAISLGAAGCGGGGDSDPLVGTWWLTTANGRAMPSDPNELSYVLNFRDNGKVDEQLIQKGEVILDTGTWSSANGYYTVTWTMIERAEQTQTNSYTVNGDTLTIVYATGVVWIFTR